jgi:hypothetical protein
VKIKFFAVLLFTSLFAFGEQELDLSFLKGLEAKAKESTSVDLGPEQLQLMMGFSGEGSKELQALGKNLERVQVRSFEFDTAGAYSLADMEKLREKLRSSDYLPFVSVKEKGGFTEIVMKKGPKGMRGFVILVAEPKEVTVVNISGDLDLASLSKLAGKFGVPNVVMGPSQPKGSKKEDE